MITAKTDIISRLKMDILPLEGFRMSMAGDILELGLGPMNRAFPQGSFYLVQFMNLSVVARHLRRRLRVLFLPWSLRL